MEKFTNIKKNYVKPTILNEEVEEEKIKIEKSSIEEFFSKLMEVKEMAHIYHLQVNGEVGSGHAHLALGDFYSEILELVDEAIEVYQGQYDILENIEINASSKKGDKLDYLKESVEFIKNNKTCIDSEDTHIYNLIDEVVALMYRTIYKLRFNK